MIYLYHFLAIFENGHYAANPFQKITETLKINIFLYGNTFILLQRVVTPKIICNLAWIIILGLPVVKAETFFLILQYLLFLL